MLFILFGLGCCGFMALIFGLMGAGRRADEGEEQILKIISPATHGIAESTTTNIPVPYLESLQSNSK
jgi:hypothetical protein